jgi:hypothetical protein
MSVLGVFAALCIAASQAEQDFGRRQDTHGILIDEVDHEHALDHERALADRSSAWKQLQESLAEETAQTITSKWDLSGDVQEKKGAVRIAFGPPYGKVYNLADAADGTNDSPQPAFEVLPQTYNISLPPLHSECKRRVGNQLLVELRNGEKVVCKANGKTKSEIRCTAGLGGGFCFGTDITVDFGKISGEPKFDVDMATVNTHSNWKHHTFSSGVLSASCTRTNHWGSTTMKSSVGKHQLGMLDTLVTQDKAEAETIENSPTLLIQRDVDGENMHHATADLMNLYVVATLLRLKPETTKGVLLDRMPDYSFAGFMHDAFASAAPLQRAADFKHGKVLFRKLVWHMESDFSSIHPSVMDPMVCRNSALWLGYISHALSAFHLWDVPPPAIPSITLLLRQKKSMAGKNIGRVLTEDSERMIRRVLAEGNAMTVQIADMANMSFREQMTLMRSTSVLVGVHGAGLQHTMYTADESVLVEIHPSYRADRHFRVAARHAGKVYMPIRVLSPIACHGSSDIITVTEREFRPVIDGAVRIARNFDDGLAECGLVCPPGILGISMRDSRHNHKPDMHDEQALSVKFPCH